MPALCLKLHTHSPLNLKKHLQMTIANLINYEMEKSVLTNKTIQCMNLLEQNWNLFQNHDPLPHDFKPGDSLKYGL